MTDKTSESAEMTAEVVSLWFSNFVVLIRPALTMTHWSILKTIFRSRVT